MSETNPQPTMARASLMRAMRKYAKLALPGADPVRGFALALAIGAIESGATLHELELTIKRMRETSERDGAGRYETRDDGRAHYTLACDILDEAVRWIDAYVRGLHMPQVTSPCCFGGMTPRPEGMRK